MFCLKYYLHKDSVYIHNRLIDYLFDITNPKYIQMFIVLIFWLQTYIKNKYFNEPSLLFAIIVVVFRPELLIVSSVNLKFLLMHWIHKLNIR